MNLFRDINIIRNDMRRYKEYILRITQDVCRSEKFTIFGKLQSNFISDSKISNIISYIKTNWK